MLCKKRAAWLIAIGLLIIFASLSFFTTQYDPGAEARSRNARSIVQFSSPGTSVNSSSSPSLPSPSPTVVGSIASGNAESRGISQSGLQLPRDQKLTLLRETYADLLAELAFSEDERERFLDLVANDWNDGEPRRRAPNLASDEFMTLLDAAKFQKYETYQRTLEQRAVVRGLEQELAVSNIEPLGETRKHDLLAALVEEHSAIPSTDIEQLSTNDKRRRVEQLAYYEQRVLQRAEFLLTEAQWVTLRTRLERSQKQRMTMSRELPY